MNTSSNVALAASSPKLNALDGAIVESLERLASISESFGYPVKPYTKKALMTLSRSTLEKKESLLKKLQTTIGIVQAGFEIEKDSPSNDYTDGYSERCFVDQALDFYGYELRDENFWKTIRKNELIEIYNSENIQIFRTFNFFTTSSYSILDLLINEWYSLWERPKGTFNDMFKVVSAVFSGEIKGLASAKVPEHVIKEIFNAEDQEHFISRSSLCRFGVICPIYNRSDGKIGGLLVSAQVTPLACGEQTKDISFI